MAEYLILPARPDRFLKPVRSINERESLDTSYSLLNTIILEYPHPIFLLGMPGCGKTYHGERLAHELNLPFVDLDEYIEDEEDKTISRIFDESGEEGFRMMERQYLEQLVERTDHPIIALGGGTPCFLNNMEMIRDSGLSIYLSAPVDVLVKRLYPIEDARPLLKGKNKTELKNYLEQLLFKRKPYYEKAELRFDITDTQSIVEVLHEYFRQL